MTDLVKEENENERQLKSAGKLLVKLCCAIYFVSYITRLDFSATMAEIIQEGVLSESSAGLIGTILFIAYGSGQIVSGILGDRISPGLLIVIGLSVASFVNFIFPCFGKVEVLCVVWGINGFAQAMLWPPMVKLLAAVSERRRLFKRHVLGDFRQSDSDDRDLSDRAALHTMARLAKRFYYSRKSCRRCLCFMRFWFSENSAERCYPRAGRPSRNGFRL